MKKRTFVNHGHKKFYEIVPRLTKWPIDKMSLHLNVIYSSSLVWRETTNEEVEITLKRNGILSMGHFVNLGPML
jgi:hypothetical protein